MKRPLIIAGCWAGSIALAVIVTRWTAPTKTVEVVREVQMAAEVLEVERQAEQVAAAERVEERVKIVYRDRVVTVPGELRETELELEASRSAAATLAVQLEQLQQREVRVEIREVERRVEVERLLPTWRVEGMIGVDQDFDLQFGGAASTRILGPISVGAWGLSSGVGGMAVGVEF